MFFILSKILFYLVMPAFMIFVGLLYAIFSKNERRKKLVIRCSLLCLWVCSNTTIVREAYRAWEIPALDPSAIIEPYDVGIILGGGMILNKEGSDSQIFIHETADRLIQPLRLYKMGKIKKILISGGTTDVGFLRRDVRNESEKVAQLLIELGVPKEDILMELKSKNTRENALFSAEILKENGLENSKILLCTSAWHERRSVGCFEKAGLKVTPFPTDFRAEAIGYTIDQLLIPRERWLYYSYSLIRELIGYGIYKVAGYC
jgi:uncharacterized SAM-binding protein YcdF (DUF218 family)